MFGYGSTAVFDLDQLCPINELDVPTRLEKLRGWRDEWKREDETLLARVVAMTGQKRFDRQKATEIGHIRRRNRIQLVKEPIRFTSTNMDKEKLASMRDKLHAAYAGLTTEERLLWLNNLVFILTPDMRRLYEKICRVRRYLSVGQQRCFLLGGPSGMGKTTFLSWLVCLQPPTVEETRNHIPIIKVNAPKTKSPKALLQRMINACGMTYANVDNSTELEMQLCMYFQQCGVELLIIDEAENLGDHEQRRRLIDLANETIGIPIVCASCNPVRFTEGDPQVVGRWNDSETLKPYRIADRRLQQLLAFVDLLLPFSQSSNLFVTSDNGKEGPAAVIERRTKGILRDIMLLVIDAANMAVERNLPCIDSELLEETWKRVQADPIDDEWISMDTNVSEQR